MGVVVNGAALVVVNGVPPTGSGGTDTGDATATAANIEAGYTAYVAGGKVTGTMDRYARATAGTTLTVPEPPTVSVTAEILT